MEDKKINEYFERMGKLSIRTPFTKVSSLRVQAKNMSVDGFRQLLKNEAKVISFEVEFALKQIDELLAERRSHNEFLRRRIEFWKCASENVQIAVSRPKANHCTHSNNASNSNSQNSSNDIFQSSSDLAYENMAVKKLSKARMKPPSLEEDQFSEATMAMLKEGPFFEKTKEILKPPNLDDMEFELKVMKEEKQDFEAKRPQQQPSTKPEMPVLSFYEKPAPLAEVKIEKPVAAVAAVQKGRNSGSEALSGSFSDIKPSAFDDLMMLRITGPVVRGDLGLCDESTASIFTIDSTATTTMACNLENTEKPQVRQGLMEKPSWPVLRATFDFPGNSKPKNYVQRK